MKVKSLNGWQNLEIGNSIITIIFSASSTVSFCKPQLAIEFQQYADSRFCCCCVQSTDKQRIVAHVIVILYYLHHWSLIIYHLKWTTKGRLQIFQFYLYLPLSSVKMDSPNLPKPKVPSSLLKVSCFIWQVTVTGIADFLFIITLYYSINHFNSWQFWSSQCSWK